MPVCVILAVILLSVFMISGCSSGNNVETNTAETTGNPGTDSNESESNSPSGQSKSEQALEQAKADGKPVLLKFGSGTCAPCIEIDKNIEIIRPEYEGKAAIITVDLNDRSEYDFAMEYNIQTIPTTIFFRKDGTIANSFVGVLTPEQLRNDLDSIIQ